MMFWLRKIPTLINLLESDCKELTKSSLYLVFHDDIVLVAAKRFRNIRIFLSIYPQAFFINIIENYLIRSIAITVNDETVDHLFLSIFFTTF